MSTLWNRWLYYIYDIPIQIVPYLYISLTGNTCTCTPLYPCRCPHWTQTARCSLSLWPSWSTWQRGGDSLQIIVSIVQFLAHHGVPGREVGTVYRLQCQQYNPWHIGVYSTLPCRAMFIVHYLTKTILSRGCQNLSYIFCIWFFGKGSVYST